MNLAEKIPLPDQCVWLPNGAMTSGQAPCVFCGRMIGHVNDCQEEGDNCVGCCAGAVVNGEVLHFLYCNDPICDERLEAESLDRGVKTCSCEGYRAYDVLGDICHVCKKPPCEPEAEKIPQVSEPETCEWCDRPCMYDSIITIGLGNEEQCNGKGERFFCSGECLFHQMLHERTNEQTFGKVQELINLP